MAYLVATGISSGRAAAIRGSLGITLGVFIYVVAVSAGLGAIATDYPVVLVVLQVLGCLYLLWLAFITVKHARVELSEKSTQTSGWFRRGLLVNLTNPKVMLFLVAFLPQFLGKASSPTAQFLLLGLMFQFVGLAIDIVIGWSAGAFREKVMARPTVLRTMSYASAATFFCLAVVVGFQAVRSLL